MSHVKLKKVLELHQMWLDKEEGGIRADLRCADLRYASLRYTNLRGADLSGANLSDVDLRYTNLSGTDLRYTNLRCADLRYANLKYADLRGADLSSANLSDVDLSGADLSGANLKYTNLRYANLKCADLRYANLNDADLSGAILNDLKFNIETSFYALTCPEKGAYIGYKKANDKIVELLITEDAKRSSATSRKCRASKAKVLSITSIDETEHFTEVSSNKDKNFIYKVGEIVEVKDFDNDRWKECSTGIHHFITRQEAVNY